jgi:predicted AAA+ superfamily ATPase
VAWPKGICVVFVPHTTAGLVINPPQLFHFRSPKGAEVDLVLEGNSRVVGIEVRSTQTATAEDFKGLKALAELAGRRFHRGLVLYFGHQAVAGSNLEAIPLTALW